MSVLLKGNIICLLDEHLSTRKTIQLDHDSERYVITNNHVIVQDSDSKLHVCDKNGEKVKFEIPGFELSGVIPNSVYSSFDYLPLINIDEKSKKLESIELSRPNQVRDQIVPEHLLVPSNNLKDSQTIYGCIKDKDQNNKLVEINVATNTLVKS
jgi:S1-C subfamily serine protease